MAQETTSLAVSSTQAQHSTSSPPTSTASSPRSIPSKRSRLSLDLSSLPPLSQPAPPSNTLLITRLDDHKIFHPASLATIREHIQSIAPLNSFSPLKSMNRIIVSFHDTHSAIAVRQSIDGSAILGSAVAKCYFGESTPIDQGMKYLNKPDAGKLFFISPPPSPPVGWEMKNEDPPNTETHAEDLASKLQKLTGKMADSPPTSEASPTSPQQQYTSEELHKLKTAKSTAMHALNDEASSSPSPASPSKMRSRSSTLIYDPKVHGDSPALPAVMLETEEEDSDVELDEGPQSETKRMLTHTARPPVELIED